MQNFDHLAKSLTKEKGPALLVPWFLMSSYTYYILDKALLSDEYYDKLCDELLEKWNDIEHPHKYLIDYWSLNAGTGFYLKEEQYPSICKNAAKSLLEKI